MVQVFPVSPKVHTTRQKALGVFSVDQTQVVSTTITLLLPPRPHSMNHVKIPNEQLSMIHM